LLDCRITTKSGRRRTRGQLSDDSTRALKLTRQDDHSHTRLTRARVAGILLDRRPGGLRRADLRPGRAAHDGRQGACDSTIGESHEMSDVNGPLMTVLLQHECSQPAYVYDTSLEPMKIIRLIRRPVCGRIGQRGHGRHPRLAPARQALPVRIHLCRAGRSRHAAHAGAGSGGARSEAERASGPRSTFARERGGQSEDRDGKEGKFKF